MKQMSSWRPIAGAWSSNAWKVSLSEEGINRLKLGPMFCFVFFQGVRPITFKKEW
jgi:hypothetical protein